MNPADLLLTTPSGRHDLAGGEGGTLAELLARRGFPLNMRCGGRGLCGGCEVELASGSLRGAADGKEIAGGEGVRVKACQARWAGGRVELSAPARSLLRHEPAVVSEFRIGVPWARDPLAPGASYGAAVDVGTTTVALLLCDLREGKLVGEASGFNAQIRSGEDVVTRIQLCASDPGAVARLRSQVTEDTIAPLLREACAKAGVGPAEVGAMTVAGNTTMLHLLAGEDPSPMGTYPFRPAFLGRRSQPARELGLDLGGGAAPVHFLPGPAAYVGADIAAGIAATGLLYDDGPSLLVDVGTNGEIVAKAGGRMLGCATAAGPAFEGAGLSSGTRAVAGAVERVRLEREPFGVELGVIGAAKRPMGICGSGYVDFLWEGRRSGVLKETGRFSEDAPGNFGPRLDADPEGRRFQLSAQGASGAVCVSERDVARLLQAKAAIAAGIATLLDLLGTEPAGVKRLHLAGGFGLHLSIEHAIGCGLLPGFAPEQVQAVGNSSLAGAFLALNDRAFLDEMDAACRAVEIVELNRQPGFENAYIDRLLLP